MEKIQILCVGGTIDKVYFDANSDYTVGEPAIDKILSELRVELDYSLLSLMKKDSLDMSDDDRAIVVKAVQKANAKKIIITHGTDTMTDTARALASIKDKTIVLTGAMAPAIFRETDAFFNVGAALAAVQTCAPGVYIAMSGKVFDANNVRKDLAAGRFVTA